MLKVTKINTNRSSFQYTFGKYMVSVFQIAGTKSWVMGVYEETPSYISDEHTFKTSHVKTGKLYGLLTSAKFDCSLPIGEERSTAYNRHFAKLETESYSILFGLFPSLLTDKSAHFDNGSVELHGDAFNHDPVEFYREPSTEWSKVYRMCRDAYRDEYLKADAKLCQWFDRETLSSIMHFVALGYDIA